jgi:predicted N-acetyltransferase YhbS
VVIVSGMKIRVALPADSKGISELISGLSAKFITGGFSSTGRAHLLDTMTPQAIEKSIQSGYQYHVAEMDGSLVGVVAVKDNKHLYHLFVAEEYQRQGIAKKLWQLAMKECLNNGNTGEFTVNSSEYARDVYTRLGFVARPGAQIKNGVVFFPMSLQAGEKGRQ